MTTVLPSNVTAARACRHEPTVMLLCLLLAACGRSGVERTGAAAAAPRPVTLAPAAQIVLPVRGSAPAEVLSPNDSELAAEVAARVLRVHADVGATVKAGAPVLTLDATDYRLALAQADARLAAARARAALAERRLARAKELLGQRFVSEDEVLALQTEREAAQADIAVAEADRRVAARNVEKCLITAPFYGVIVERLAQVGTLATVGTPLVRLVDLSPAEIEASVQRTDAAELAESSELAFESQGRRYSVRLLRIAPVVERAARTRVARFAFEDAAAPAGSSGTITWRAPGQRLPAALLVRRGEALGFFAAENGRARFVPAPGAQPGRPFAVDVPPESRIVVRGHQALTDGDAIAERPNDAAAAAPARAGGSTAAPDAVAGG